MFYRCSNRLLSSLQICLFVITVSSQSPTVVITHHESSRLGAPDSVTSIKGKSSKKDGQESSNTTSQVGDVKDAPVIASNNVATGNSTGTHMFYPRYTDHLCKKDCPTDDSFECAGVLEDTSGISLFDTVQECCAESFGWIDGTLCAALSTNTTTNLFYVSIPDDSCKKHCPVDPANFECGGNPDDLATALFETVDECCAAKLPHIEESLCVAISTNTSTNKFYLLDDVCKQDCPINATKFECGGNPKDVSTTLFDTVEKCCSEKLAFIDNSLCVAIATNTSTDLFYVFEDSCKQDCPIDSATFECGGTPEDLSIALFGTLEECCAEKLSYIDSSLCVAISTNTTTDKFYVSYAEKICKQDCPVDPASFECGGTPEDLSTPLFATVGECCSEKLAFIDLTLCTAISLNETTDKFYVSYTDKVCKKDCPIGRSFECGGTPEDLTTKLFGTVEECCSEKLSYIDKSLCAALSLNKTTDKFYVSYPDEKCLKDCPVGDAPECGGTPGDLSTALFETAAECCIEKLSYIDESLCSALSLNKTTGQFYVSYPDEACKKDCPVGEAPECGGTPEDTSVALFETVEECCTEKLAYIDESLCVAISLNKTTNKFYVFYPDEVCKADCPVGDKPECGGTPEDSSVTLFLSVEKCCAEKLAYIDGDLCVALSLNKTTDKFYVSYPDETCKKDCPVGDAPECGGAPDDLSTMLFDTVEECCVEKLAYIEKSLCTATSLNITTELFYVLGEVCKKDCPVGDAPECGGTPEDTSNKLFKTVEECCTQKLAYIDGELCAALSLNKTTDKFYVSYPDESCKKDCPVGEAPECGGSPVDLSTMLFDTAEECCAEKLAYIEKSLCTATSLNITTDLFYVLGEVCKKDCPVGDAPECGGTPEDTSTKLFKTVEECCTQKLAYIDGELCAALSLNKTTDKFYVSYPDESCKKDCPVGEAPECGGSPVDLSTMLFDTAEECCAEKLAYIEKSLCTATSLNTTTELFYVLGEVCKKDCPVGDAPECGGTPEDTSTKLFKTVEECCTQKLAYIDGELCAALSLNKTTDKFYVSYPDESCKKDCPVGDAPECGGTPHDLSTMLFDTAEECCVAKLSYIDKRLCAAISTDQHTNLFYVSYPDEACKKDCPAYDGGQCGGTPQDLSIRLFSTVSECCKEKLSWVELSKCVASV